MSDVPGFVRKAAEKCGFLRERYDDSHLPTDVNRICVVPFFGDLRSTFVLSSLFLKRFRDQERGSKYVIVCSWPGFGGLFPFADEYWGLQDVQASKKLYQDSSQFRNKNLLVTSYYRNLNEHFFEDMVLPYEQFAPYYSRGIQDKFWVKYKGIILRFLPSVPSTANLGKDFNRDLASRGGFKVFLFPSTHIQQWRLGDIGNIPVSKEFWLVLAKRMLAEKFVPVVYKSFMTHDLSGELTGKCLFVDEPDISKVLTVMRSTSCVLDVFSGISKLALAARCPFLMVDERSRFAALKEYEIDDLCGKSLPRQYIFSFPTIIDGGTIETWDDDILDSIIVRLNAFLPDLDRDTWPSTGESFEQVPYDTIRKKKMKRFGTRLLRIPND